VDATVSVGSNPASPNGILTAKGHPQGGFPVLDTTVVSEVITETSPKWPW